MSTVGYGNVSLMDVYDEKFKDDIKIAIYMMMASIFGFSLCQARLTSYIYGNNQREVNSDFFKQRLSENMEAFFL